MKNEVYVDLQHREPHSHEFKNSTLAPKRPASVLIGMYIDYLLCVQILKINFNVALIGMYIDYLLCVQILKINFNVAKCVCVCVWVCLCVCVQFFVFVHACVSL